MENYIAIIERSVVKDDELIGILQEDLNLTHLPRIGETIVGKAQTTDGLKIFGGKVVDVEHCLHKTWEIRLYIEY